MKSIAALSPVVAVPSLRSKFTVAPKAVALYLTVTALASYLPARLITKMKTINALKYE